MIGSDPEGRLGEAPRPELREHGRISGACFDAARGIIDGLKVLYFELFLLSLHPVILLLLKFALELDSESAAQLNSYIVNIERSDGVQLAAILQICNKKVILLFSLYGYKKIAAL